MSKSTRNGKRKSRETLSKSRPPELGYYFIVTDTKETEKNYFNGLKASIPVELQRKLVVKVIETETKNLVNEALNMASLHPQYGEPWIIFDRDQVSNFDEIICEAEKYHICVGWANPCIETWFNAYLGSMPPCIDSVDCCSKFGEAYAKKSGQHYEKSDSSIYSKLNRYGDEEKAFSIADQKYKQNYENYDGIPSKMSPCTTIHLLVREINQKIPKS